MNTYFYSRVPADLCVILSKCTCSRLVTVYPLVFIDFYLKFGATVQLWNSNISLSNLKRKDHKIYFHCSRSRSYGRKVGHLRSVLNIGWRPLLSRSTDSRKRKLRAPNTSIAHQPKFSHIWQQTCDVCVLLHRMTTTLELQANKWMRNRL